MYVLQWRRWDAYLVKTWHLLRPTTSRMTTLRSIPARNKWPHPAAGHCSRHALYSAGDHHVNQDSAVHPLLLSLSTQLLPYPFSDPVSISSERGNTSSSKEKLLHYTGLSPGIHLIKNFKSKLSSIYLCMPVCIFSKNI